MGRIQHFRKNVNKVLYVSELLESYLRFFILVNSYATYPKVVGH